MLIVRSPVRISFAGGGTDLPAYYEKFGGAVLSTSINKYFYTILQKRTDGKIQVISSDLRVVETWRDISCMDVKSSALEIPLSVIKELQSDLSVDLFLASEIMAGTGLGSSASVCVGVLKTLATYVDLPLSKYELAERSFHIARDILGKPVGKQDEYAAAFGGLNFITFHADGTTYVEPIELRSDYLREFESSLMLFFTGVAHNSWKLLQEQEQSTKKQIGSTVESLHELHDLAEHMRGALVKGDMGTFGDLLHQSWEAKKKISSNISNPLIDEAYALARRNGARGGKVAGAGGGGFLLLSCSQPHQDKVRDALTKLQLREMAFGLDTQGAKVIVNDPFIDRDEKCGTRWTFAPAFSLQPVLGTFS
ncbi:MAG: GHMP kinase [Acidobacteria bacterium]|nr:MAG: GHMP kinase [Acidobacteriota bacterium]